MFKIFFLIKSKSSFKICLNFLTSKFKNILDKKKIVSSKRKHQSFIKTKKITKDYFSSHAFNFLNYLKNLKADFDYLEIGSSCFKTLAEVYRDNDDMQATYYSYVYIYI